MLVFRHGYFRPAAETVLNLAVVAEIDGPLQAFQQGVVVVIQVAVVEDEGVELIAGLEAAHLAEETSSRLRGHPERFGQGKE